MSVELFWSVLNCMLMDCRLVQDHTDGSSIHSQTLATMQERLREAEQAIRREEDSFRQMQVIVVLFFLCAFDTYR